MEFLKAILGDALFTQVVEKINAHNGAEENKDNQIKIANLATGEYVGKGKYDSAVAESAGKQSELDKANALIAELKKGNKDNETLQTKITTYEGEIAELQKKLEETQKESALKVAMLSANVTDVDYLTFKLKTKLTEAGKEIKLDANGNVEGWDEILTTLKTEFPNQFSSDSSKKVIERKLENGDDNHPLSKADILRMPYNKRSELYQSDPETYNKLMNE